MKKNIAIVTAMMLSLSMAGCGAASTSGASGTASASAQTDMADASDASAQGNSPSDTPGSMPDAGSEEKTPGEKPEDASEGKSEGEAPREDSENAPDNKPDGTAPGEKPDDAPGEKPDDAPDGKPGDAPDGKPGDAPGGKPGDAPGGKPGDAPGGKPGSSGASDITYTAATSFSEAASDDSGVYSSQTADENAVLIDTTQTVTLTSPSVTKTGDSDGGDNCNFYGLNAGILVKGGATVNISGGTVTTDAKGANGVFSYGGNGGQNGGAGDGTTVNISDTVIKTTGDGAGGIMTTGGGVTNASNLTIDTSGQSSAAIRTDRGGGSVTVTGGRYTTNGLGSPAIYSTADIKVSDAVLTSNLSEGVCIEGKNSVELTDCDLTVSNTKCNGHATFLDSIMIYQSMSGDADSGTSAFTMTGGSLTSRSGHVFHVTNTNAVITLSGVGITNEDADSVLLSVCDDGWSGAENIATLKTSGQTLSGRILVGDNSKLTLSLTDGSAFTGSIGGQIKDSTGRSVSTETGDVSVSLDSSSSWTLTADSYITAFDGDVSQIVSNGYKLYVNGKAIN